MKCNKWVSAAMAALALLTVNGRAAQAETFTYSGAIGSGQTWESDPNWLGDAGELVDKYPGQTVATDNATTSIDLGGTALGIDISGTIGVVTLTLGDTNATPSATTIGGAGTLTAGTINSAGTAGAVNTIDVDLLSSGTNFGGGNGLIINGDVTLNGGGSKTLRNQVAQTITYNGAIILSNGGSAGNVTFRQDNDASITFLNGVISNGAVAPASGSSAQVNYARGTFHNTVDNTYTGMTVLGANSPNNASTNIIYTDGVFGTGRVQFGGGGAIKTIAGAAGMGTRTLANDVQLSRDGRFAGPESIVLNGKLFMSNTRSLINDIDAGKSLTLNGPVFTDSGTNANDKGRVLTLNGSGTTIVNGAIDDKDGDATATLGRVKQAGSGRTIYAAPGVAQYANATEVVAGTLQLGTGGAAVGLNNHSVQGIAGGTGVLEINHSSNLSFDAALSYDLTVNHVGSGTTTMTSSSFGGGLIDVQAGKLVVDGGLYAGFSSAGLRDPDGTGNTGILGVSSTAGLRRGQPVTLTPGPGGTATPPANVYIVDILSPFQVLLSSNLPTDATSGNNWNADYGAGTGTGTASVLASGGIVGGNGVIGGSLTVGSDGRVAPGSSIGTLTVLGDGTIGGGFDVEYDGAGAGSIDLLAVSGNLTLDGASSLNFSAIGSPADDAAYVFATYGGTLSGTFGSVSNQPAGYALDYAYGGNSIALVRIPEPATIALLGLGCAALVARRRR